MFKNLDADSKKMLKRGTVGTVILTAIMVAIFVALKFIFIKVDFFGKIDLFEVGLGALCGALVAILVFFYLAYSIGERTVTEDPELAAAKYNLSKKIRLGIQVAWMIVAILVPVFNAIAAIFPLFFPKRALIICGIMDNRRENKKSGTGGEHDQQ